MPPRCPGASPRGATRPPRARCLAEESTRRRTACPHPRSRDRTTSRCTPGAARSRSRRLGTPGCPGAGWDRAPTCRCRRRACRRDAPWRCTQRAAPRCSAARPSWHAGSPRRSCPRCRRPRPGWRGSAPRPRPATPRRRRRSRCARSGLGTPRRVVEHAGRVLQDVPVGVDETKLALGGHGNPPSAQAADRPCAVRDVSTRAMLPRG